MVAGGPACIAGHCPGTPGALVSVQCLVSDRQLLQVGAGGPALGEGISSQPHVPGTEGHQLWTQGDEQYKES